MSKLEIQRLTLLIVITACVSLVAAQSSGTPALPDGPMAGKVTTACTECHDARIILQQRLSKAAWTKEVDKMTKWGAVVDPADREAFIEYLSSNFPPDKRPYQAPRMKK